MAEPDKTTSRPPRKIGVREFRSNFSGFMRQVRDGSSFVVTSRDEVVALIQPPQPTSPPRREPGALRGRIKLASDFDATSPELLAAMEGEGE